MTHHAHTHTTLHTHLCKKKGPPNRWSCLLHREDRRLATTTITATGQVNKMSLFTAGNWGWIWVPFRPRIIFPVFTDDFRVCLVDVSAKCYQTAPGDILCWWLVFVDPTLRSSFFWLYRKHWHSDSLNRFHIKGRSKLWPLPLPIYAKWRHC